MLKKFTLSFILSICGLLGLLIILNAPDLSRFHTRSQVVFDNKHKIIYAKLTPSGHNRILTTPQEVDKLYIDLLLSAEDERFYSHMGVDIIAIIRALISNISSFERVSGASTIAMQVCRLLEPKERTLINKIKEALGAIYLTLRYGREQVLTMYLTLAPFGGNIEGVNAASYMYFNQSPKKLTPAQAAFLVALPRAPESIRPDRYPKKSKYYRNLVLKKGVADGVIQEDVLTAAQNEIIPTKRYPLPQDAFYLGQSIFYGKLKQHTEQTFEIHSTIESDIQHALLDAAKQYTEQYLMYENESIALIALDNQNFNLLGYVGSYSHKKHFVDIIQAIRSPGSSLKPFIYAQAFDLGILHPQSILIDNERIYNTYQPRNYDKKFFGQITASQALRASLNLPALEIMRAIGPEHFVNKINTIPLNNYTPSSLHQRLILAKNTKPNLGIALGGVGISLYDLTSLYAAIANNGSIKSINYLNPPSTQQKSFSLIKQDSAQAIYNILSLMPPPHGYIQDKQHAIAYKTGTSYKYRDALAIGSKDNITLGVWIGNIDGSPSSTLSGYEKAAPILFNAFSLIDHKFFTQRLNNTQNINSSLLDASPPALLKRISIDSLGHTYLAKGNTHNSNFYKDDVQKIKLIFPPNNMRVAPSSLGRINIKVEYAQEPYVLLINDEIQAHNTYFTPPTNGIYNLTIIDAKGNALESQVFVYGVKK